MCGVLRWCLCAINIFWHRQVTLFGKIIFLNQLYVSVVVLGRVQNATCLQQQGIAGIALALVQAVVAYCTFQQIQCAVMGNLCCFLQYWVTSDTIGGVVTAPSTDSLTALRGFAGVDD